MDKPLRLFATSVACLLCALLLSGFGGGQILSGVLNPPVTPPSTGLALVTGAAHTCTNFNTTGASLSCTVTGANSGDGLVIYGSTTAGGGTISFSDSAGTPATPVIYSGPLAQSGITVVTNISSGSHVITFPTGLFQSFIYVQEYSGMATSSALGANNSGNNGTFTPANCSALTSAQTNSMTFVGIAIGSAATGPATWGSWTNSFVQRQTNTSINAIQWATADNVATLNGSSGSSISTSQPYTSSGSNAWDCLLVEIKHQ